MYNKIINLRGEKMLLDFKMKNFKSFYNKTDFTMMADTSKRENKERLVKISDTKRTGKYALPSMVIYGQNASGKTSIIQAINVLKQIVINGTIKRQIGNEAITELEIDPFIHDEKKFKEPIEFEITFDENNVIYNYILGVKVSQKQREISNEELNIIEFHERGTSIEEVKTNIFKRTNKDVKLNTELNALKILNKKEEFKSEAENFENIFSKNLDKEDLFLTTGFKSLISLNMETIIVDWFQESLITVVDFNEKEPIINFKNINKNKTIYSDSKINKLVKLADFGPQRIGYIKNPVTGKFEMNSIYKQSGTEGALVVNSENIESKGTIKMISFWLGWLKYAKKGGVFVLDELDASIHPELIGEMIKWFNDPEENEFHSQLIFNTLNPLYLQRKYYRRDQITLTQKDKKYMSSISRLSDKKVRNDGNYMKQCFDDKIIKHKIFSYDEVEL